MSETITPEFVSAAFQEAAACAGAENCKKAAEAMCAFFRLDNQHTLETGEGRLTFYTPPEGPCPNTDQLLCQHTEY